MKESTPILFHMKGMVRLITLDPLGVPHLHPKRPGTSSKVRNVLEKNKISDPGEKLWKRSVERSCGREAVEEKLWKSPMAGAESHGRGGAPWH